MKQTKRNHCKMALLALASAVLLTPVVQAQTLTTSYHDLILGFRASANPGQTANLQVNLGDIEQLYSVPAGTEVPLSRLSLADLVATYGASWHERADLFWGAIGSTSRFAGYTSNSVSVGQATIWATRPDCGNPWERGSLVAQRNAIAKSEAMIVAGAPGTMLGKTPTVNSPFSVVINATLEGSWTAQETSVEGTSFGFFSGSGAIMNFEGTNIVVSQLYEVQVGSGPATYIGDLILRNTGLSFRRGAATAAVCQNVTVQADESCTASISLDDIDDGSTGFCLSLELDQTGPFPIGTTNVTLTVIDATGSTNTCDATVTVEGGAPSVASVATVNQCDPVVTYTTPTASGCNTPIGAVTCNPPSGSTFPSGNTTVICTATDAADKIGSNSFTVTISAANPTVSCPSNIVTSVLSNETSIVINYTTPTGSGCAAPVNVVCVPASGFTANVGTTNVVCTATDALSNIGTCSFSVTVNGAGINGLQQQVADLTGPKLTPGRKNSLNKALIRAQTKLTAYELNPSKPGKLKQACAQLKSVITRSNVYGRVGIISQVDAAALVAAVNAQRTQMGCP